MVRDLETWARRHCSLTPAVLFAHDFRHAAWRGSGKLDAEEGHARPPVSPHFLVPQGRSSSWVGDVCWSEMRSSSDNVVQRELCSDRVGRSDPCLGKRLPSFHASSFVEQEHLSLVRS
ncbi:hypothetical protein M9H77_29495 [Catharanthus roseus]|uniref:Uncharacterized protein n=1 Tax=Catharanthus roseus TaxID=4058 RepID=A0ACB9ZWS5_CATRO|nr:hypothetical protein M9H77_29495 [Catharanthus roseus]